MRVRIHQVQLGEDADRPPALGVDGAHELERVRVGEVYVCGGDGEDDANVRVRVCVRVCACVGGESHRKIFSEAVPCEDE